MSREDCLPADFAPQAFSTSLEIADLKDRGPKPI
jgi:hypothetical protein